MEAGQRDAWSRTAHLMATILNVNRDPRKSKVVSPDDLMPKPRRQPRPLTTDITALKMFLTKGQP